MVDCQNRHRRIERIVIKGQMLGNTLYQPCRRGRALRNHFSRRLNGCDLPALWLVRSGPGADIDDGLRVA